MKMSFLNSHTIQIPTRAKKKMAPEVKKKPKKPKNERVRKSTNFQTIAYLS